jgi:hypothetical protein
MVSGVRCSSVTVVSVNTIRLTQGHDPKVREQCNLLRMSVITFSTLTKSRDTARAFTRSVGPGFIEWLSRICPKNTTNAL